MRRRPIEFWWISAYCVARTVAVFSFLFHDADRLYSSALDRGIFFFYGSALFFVPALLFSFQTPGRWLGTIILGVEAVEMAHRMVESVEVGGGVEADAALAFAGCLWLSLFLQRASTARLFETDSSQTPTALPVSFAAGFNVPSLFDALVAFTVGASARVLGAPIEVAIATGIVAYIAYGIFFEEHIRSRWDSYFARIEPDFPESESRGWRGACSALAGNDLVAARSRFDTLSPDAQMHPAGRLFEMALEWHELLSHPPLNGREAFRRLVFDHDYLPEDEDRFCVGKYVQTCSVDDVQALALERAECVGALVLALSNPASFFRGRADRMLTRMTGESFAFNAPENWATWWRTSRTQWTGDAAPLGIVARLIFKDCHDASVAVAKLAAGRAEEPLVIELAEQMRFFNSMRAVANGVGAPASFMTEPLRVLLVPEWADAAGWLHADSPILPNLGVSRRAVARRLLMRPKLLDFVASFWKHYPADLNADLPWLLPLLTGKQFGMMRARSRFEAWWPQKRGTFLRHAKAMNEGLNSFVSGESSAAERAYELALIERPNDLSARYNLALCRSKRNDRDGAEQLLRELAGMEPKEPFWWMALGDLLRADNKALAARSAYRRAQDLGASEGRVALHVGLTFAHEDRNSEAMQLFERVLGQNPSASKLEALATQLEKEGCWKLAGHYREEALRRELDGPGGFTDNESGDETPA
ncbi:MAG: tetratricopeptide repeat protein [Planctomycetota bacterium]